MPRVITETTGDPVPSMPSQAFPAELTAEWLTGVLRSTGSLSHAVVKRILVQPLDENAGATGRLVRILPTYDRMETHAPASLIVKYPRDAGAALDLARRFRLYEREARFYVDVAPLPGLRTPELYYAGPNNAGDPVLILEDVAEAAAGDLISGCHVDTVAPLVPMLAHVHAHHWNGAALDALNWLPRPNAAPTVSFSMQNYPRAWKAFRRRIGQLSSDTEAVGDRLSGDRSVLDRLSEGPCTLTHGDLRLNNLMFDASLAFVAVIDWQSVTLARGPMDIASLLVSNLAPAECRVAETELLPGYREALIERGVRGYSQDECWKDYRLAVLAQFAGAVMLSSFLDLGRNQAETTAALIGRPLAAVAELNVLELLPPKQTRAKRLISKVRSSIRSVS